MNSIDFIKTAIKDYKIGALTSSSRYVVEDVVRKIGPEHKYIVEYGAGDGIITKEILKCLPSNGRLVALELNKDFIQELKNIHDPRLVVMEEDVVGASREPNIFGLPRIDAVISGIPFTLFTSREREAVIRNTHALLSPNGIFVVYQYSPLVFSILKKFFNEVRISFEPRNFLPYFIMRARK